MPRKDRKPRENLVNQDLNTMEPIDIMELGGDNDPCFGKHHDLKAEECERCGDAELCQIAMSQNLHKKRLLIEAKSSFKDLDEEGITTVEFERDKKRISIKVKNAKGRWVLIKELKTKKAELKEVLKILKSTKHIKYNKSKTKIRWI